MAEQDDDAHPAITSQEVILEPISDELLGHAERQQIGTHAFRKCSISTTISDLRRCSFFDSQLNKIREACICFFQLEFGSQKPGSRQRISDIDVEVMFNESDYDDSAKAPAANDDDELCCKAIYPSAARGAADVGHVSHRIGADIRPEYMNISVGGVTFDRTTKQDKKSAMEFRTSSAGDMGYRLQLTENIINKSGIPSSLRFAVLLQTDGLPFSVELSFAGKVPSLVGTKLGGRLLLKIDRKHLWMRTRNDEGNAACQDADSNEFLEWVKKNTRNSWAEAVEYDV